MSRLVVLAAGLSVAIAGCATTSQRVLDSNQNQLQLRSIQTRVFATSDKEKTLQAAIATLQDLGFIIHEANATLGTASATKPGSALRMTVGVYPRGESQLAVRANAQSGYNPVDDPELYQQFFSALGKSLFLSAEEVNGGAPAVGP